MKIHIFLLSIFCLTLHAKETKIQVYTLSYKEAFEFNKPYKTSFGDVFPRESFRPIKSGGDEHFKRYLVTGSMRVLLLSKVKFSKNPLSYKNIDIWYNEKDNLYSVNMYVSKNGGDSITLKNVTGQWIQKNFKFVH